MSALCRNTHAWGLPPQRPIILPAATIHIWKAWLSDAISPSVLNANLPVNEHTSSKRPSSKLTRAYLRNILSRYTDTPSTELSICNHQFGKPFLPTGPHFNIAHTRDAAVFAIADRPVGIDIEFASRRLTNLSRLLSRVTPAEALAVRRAMDPHYAFLSLWTRKEAFVKCTGEGIQRGLSSFDISLARQSDWLQSIDSDLDASVKFSSCAIGFDDYLAAVVYEGRPARVVLYDWHAE